MLTLKPATMEDCRLVFEWRNHIEVRRHFFDEREIPYAEHEAWFRASLARDDRIILIAHDKDRPVGVIRFDTLKDEPDTAEIDIYVSPHRQGKGLGTRILAEGEEWIRTHKGVRSLVARVKADNPASLRMFRGRGFESKHIFFRKGE